MSSDVVVADGELVIRRMRDDDSDYNRMVEWRNRPHVRRWWDPDDPPLTLDAAREEYRPDTLPDSDTKACIIELQGKPIGFIQFYRWMDDDEEYAREMKIPIDDLTYGLDILIGDPNQVGRGVGTRAVRLMSDYLLNEFDASSVALTTEIVNHAATRAYEKAGFRRIKEVLDTDTYKGERVRSWLMVKEPA